VCLRLQSKPTIICVVSIDLFLICMVRIICIYLIYSECSSHYIFIETKLFKVAKDLSTSTSKDLDTNLLSDVDMYTLFVGIESEVRSPPVSDNQVQITNNLCLAFIKSDIHKEKNCQKFLDFGNIEGFSTSFFPRIQTTI
jgi:hypothetical protein